MALMQSTVDKYNEESEAKLPEDNQPQDEKHLLPAKSK